VLSRGNNVTAIWGLCGTGDVGTSFCGNLGEMVFFPSRYVALQLGPVAIHWYGIMYLLAFLTVWWMVPRLSKYRALSFTKEQISSLITFSVLGTLIGGRLGYVLFYAPEYFGDHPFETLQIWKGGMSSHGGFVGVVIAALLFCKKNQIDPWRLADVAVVPVAIGLAFGRFGNFINQELYGPVTTLPWGMTIPGVEGVRHPTQLYAVAKDLLIAVVCFVQLKRVRNPGIIFGYFLVLYGFLRFFVEYLRVQTASGVAIGMIELTRGQFLTIPIIVIGVYFLWKRNEI
jgi:phosphatidylglycerol---prolipoprotein diacylglyceryl transferase